MTESQLRIEAIEAAQFRGHYLDEFETLTHGCQVAECLLCGKQAFVEMEPMPNGVRVGGEAVALNCED